MTEEQKQCKDTLEAGKVWECYHTTQGYAKAFVSTAYGGLDFDTNFLCRPGFTVFGPVVYIKKIRK